MTAVARKVAAAMDTYFEKINTTEDYLSTVKDLWGQCVESPGITIKPFHSRVKDVSLRLFESFHTGIEIEDDVMWSRAEERTRKLLKVAPRRDFYTLWQRKIHDTIRNMIFGGRGHFPLSIDSHDELAKVIKSWQALGLSVYPGEVVRSVVKYLKKRYKNPEEHIDVYSRVAEILGPYVNREPKLSSFIAYDERYWSQKYDRRTLRAEIIERANRQRRVVNGRHTRDHRLARLLKLYHEYTCTACGRKQSNSLLIQMSHKIPLSLGVQKGGIDSPINMEPLCTECHERYEEQFDNDLHEADENERGAWLASKQRRMLAHSEWLNVIEVPECWGMTSGEVSRVDRPAGSKKKHRFLIFCVDCKRRYRRPLIQCPKCGGRMQRYRSKMKGK